MLDLSSPARWSSTSGATGGGSRRRRGSTATRTSGGRASQALGPGAPRVGPAALAHRALTGLPLRLPPPPLSPTPKGTRSSRASSGRATRRPLPTAWPPRGSLTTSCRRRRRHSAPRVGLRVTGATKEPAGTRSARAAGTGGQACGAPRAPPTTWCPSEPHLRSYPPATPAPKGTSMRCSKRTKLCKDEFTGNTMVQVRQARGLRTLCWNSRRRGRPAPPGQAGPPSSGRRAVRELRPRSPSLPRVCCRSAPLPSNSPASPSPLPPLPARRRGRAPVPPLQPPQVGHAPARQILASLPPPLAGPHAR
jgi:hypothetical protein